MRFPSSVRAAVCALALVFSAGAFAQGMGGGSIQATPKDKSAKEKAAKPAKGENKYPNATRKEPKLDMSSGDQKDLNKAADLINDNKNDEAEPIVQKVLSNEKASKYAQAFAHTLQAQIYYEKDKSADAIAEYKKAVDMDALPNDAHFQTIYQIAQLQVQDEKYADALVSLDQWQKLSGSDTAEELALKANAYYRTDKFQDAVDTMKKALAMTDKPSDSWTQILMASYFALNQYDQAAQVVQQQMAKNPSNKKLLNQLATIYIQADKPQQALDLMAKAKSQGLITTSDDYMQLAKLQAVGRQVQGCRGDDQGRHRQEHPETLVRRLQASGRRLHAGRRRQVRDRRVHQGVTAGQRRQHRLSARLSPLLFGPLQGCGRGAQPRDFQRRPRAGRRGVSAARRRRKRLESSASGTADWQKASAIRARRRWPSSASRRPRAASRSSAAEKKPKG